MKDRLLSILRLSPSNTPTTRTGKLQIITTNQRLTDRTGQPVGFMAEIKIVRPKEPITQ